MTAIQRVAILAIKNERAIGVVYKLAWDRSIRVARKKTSRGKRHRREGYDKFYLFTEMKHH